MSHPKRARRVTTRYAPRIITLLLSLLLILVPRLRGESGRESSPLSKASILPPNAQARNLIDKSPFDLSIRPAPLSPASTFVVTNINDSGAGSLRQAILSANVASGTNIINFNISGGGVHSIKPNTMLPTITNPVIIDGTTQPGYTGTPLIELDGSVLGANSHTNGLTLSGGNSTVRGLIVNRWDRYGIWLMTNGGNTIAGNWLGIDSTGTVTAAIGATAVFIDNIPNNLVGGTTVADRNIISGSGNWGVAISGTIAANNRIVGNYVGTDPAGTTALGNLGAGVLVGALLINSISDNLISGNQGDGINLNAPGGTGTTVTNNRIGVDASGTSPLPNLGHGISITSSNNLIGGTGAGMGNLIAFNGHAGIDVFAGTGNLVRRNLIYGQPNYLDVDLGNDWIDHNSTCQLGGANNHQNFPTIISASSGGGFLFVQGSLTCKPNNTYALDFLAHPTCGIGGHGGGRIFVGSINVTTDSVGLANFNPTFAASIPSGYVTTATATSPANDTSEFSVCQTITKNSGQWRMLIPAILKGS